MRIVALLLLATTSLVGAEVIGWRCWYNSVRDGGCETTTVYQSVEHTWNDLPPVGFQVMMIYYDNGHRRIVQGTDFYWRCTTRPDGICHGQKDPGGDRRLGLTISDEEFNRIHAEAWAARAAPVE